ncbi:MAG: hypothetical protein JSR85_03965 [Proteobacteria bacterium]|nr:hypothetical protein [Pseudomonadota bacterium]
MYKGGYHVFSFLKKTKKIIKLKYVLAAGGMLFFLAIACLTYLVSTDSYTDASFRTMQDSISTTEQVDLNGLRELQASGGPSVDFEDLKNKLRHVKSKIIIVDGIRQKHGYIKKIPSAFLGYNLHDADLRHFIRRLIYTSSVEERPELVTPESEIAKQYGFEYTNIKIESKFRSPDGAIDAFVTFIDTLPEDVWLHFHCRHGKGRTTMMLTMYDIMKNAPIVTLRDIIKRQYLLGSVDLDDTTAWKKSRGTYSSKTLKRRKKFIEQFYDFICQRKAGGIQKWSDWRRQQLSSGAIL